MTYVFELLCGIVAFTFMLIAYRMWRFKYWERKNVPTIKSHFFWGNIDNQLKTTPGINYNIKCAYSEFKKRGEKHGGIYLLSDAVYLPIDPELIKNIMAKDFHDFSGRGVPINEEKDPLTVHLLFLDGDPWKKMRVKLTPTFTSGKMKTMFNMLLKCGSPMIEHIDELRKNNIPLDMKEILACFTTDVIGSCAFGLECNSFKDPNAEFRTYGRKVFTSTLYNKLIRFVVIIAPKINNIVYFRQVERDIEKFFISVIKRVLDYRKENNIKRNDFVQILMELNQKAIETGQEPLTLKQLTAQAFIFFLAGFETSATTMSFCLHELAFNQDIQDKLREEIRETMKKHNGKLTYDGIMDMKYMDQVVNETLRKHPPVPNVVRICNTPYKIPNSNVTIDVGTRVFISILGLHWDEQYYPIPQKFDPERFSEENKATRPAYTFLPFGEGPRACIGLRFGLMQTKTGLAILLNNYRILPVKSQNYDLNLDFSGIVTSIRGPLLLNLEKLS